MDGLLAGSILLTTLALVLVRPGGIDEAWWAVLGGGATVLLGLVSLRQAEGVLLETRDAIVLLIGMMALSAVAERAGFFDWATAIAARVGGGRVSRLYGMVFLIGTLVTATLSLDATAIVLTPIVYSTVVRLRLSPLPFMFACAYAANTASLFLPVSNLTNLLAYNAFDLGFARFGLIMFLPATMAVLANALVFAWLFREDLRGFYEAKPRPYQVENPAFFRVAIVGITGVLTAFFLSPVLGVPVSALALAGGLLVAGWALAKRWMTPREVVGSMSWGIVALILGLFLVVQAVQNAGLVALLERTVAAVGEGNSFPQILGVAAGTALGSNLINNLPMTIVLLNVLEAPISGGLLGSGAVYAALIGTNVGPNLTVVGSLATLIWLGLVRGRGLEITAREYLKVGIIATPVILLAATLGLWVSLQLFGA